MDLVDETATTSMEVGWYQKMSGVKHTGIVVVIDDEPRYTIDFDGYNVNVHEWEDEVRRIHGMFKYVPFELKIMQQLQPNQHTTQGRNAKAKHFMSIVVKSKANKDLANNILKDIQKIKMGKYNVMKQNCRDHVQRVYHMLEENWGVNSRSFNIEMKGIRDKDNKKIAVGVKIFAEVWSLIYRKIAEASGEVNVLSAAETRLFFSNVGFGMLDVVSKSAMAVGKTIQGCDVSNSNDNASPEESFLYAVINKQPCSFGYNKRLLELKENGVFNDCVWNRRYSKYFREVHPSPSTYYYDDYDYDDFMTHFFIIPPNIEINDENVKEILHDMLMMGMAPSITSVLDEDIDNVDKVYKKDISPRRYITRRYIKVLQQVFKDFGRQLTSDCRVLVFKTTDLIHSKGYTSEAEIISFKY